MTYHHSYFMVGKLSYVSTAIWVAHPKASEFRTIDTWTLKLWITRCRNVFTCDQTAFSPFLGRSFSLWETAACLAGILTIVMGFRQDGTIVPTWIYVASVCMGMYWFWDKRMLGATAHTNATVRFQNMLLCWLQMVSVAPVACALSPGKIIQSCV